MPNQKLFFNKLIQFLLIVSLFLLPFSHLRWLPNLGTTRPISSIIFVLIVGLRILSKVTGHNDQNNITVKKLLAFNDLRDLIKKQYGAPILLPWVILIFLGSISAAFTPLYGNFFQALNRLLGYVIILSTLYCGIIALKFFTIQQIATIVSLGYLPVLAYGIIEAIATRGVFWAYQVVQIIRSLFVVDFTWAWRTSYFATEPSFIGFQLLLLIALFPFLSNWWLRITNFLIILIALFFSQSGTIYITIAVYIAFLIFFTLPYRLRVWSAALCAIGVSIVLVWMAFFSPYQLDSNLIEDISVALNIPRLKSLFLSSSIRNTYLMNLIYALIDTRGLGLGIGQYGHFWKEIFLRHFNLATVDPTGEIVKTLASSDYARPWSVILGIGVDLGIIGLLVLLIFFYNCWRYIFTPHARSIFLASLLALFGAYPIVTPHVWLALALLTGVSAFGRKELSAQ